MKARKTMKTMKKAASMKRSMKTRAVSVIAKGVRARAAVFAGTKQRTQSGLSKADLVKSKSGRIVSKKRSARAKRSFASSALAAWAAACRRARKELGITGFVPVGGKSAKGRALHAKVKSVLK